MHVFRRDKLKEHMDKNHGPDEKPPKTHYKPRKPRKNKNIGDTALSTGGFTMGAIHTTIDAASNYFIPI